MSELTLRFHGPLTALTAADRAALIARAAAVDESVREGAACAIRRVRKDGDLAIRELMREFHGVSLDSIEVSRARRRQALAAIDPTLRDAMERAADNLSKAHGAMIPRPIEVETEPGVVVGRRPDPLARVGVYAPGGRAAYPSTVLMCAIPARIAGVNEIVLCSPPGPDGIPSESVLAAAELARIDRVFAAGGPAAIAAMAFGTRCVPRVDRIVGPGNAWVSSAKLQLVDQVSIDSPAGPSEILVIADTAADPECLARELVAQAEHDPQACAVAIAIGDGLAEAIVTALGRALASQPRRETIARALAGQGGVLATESLAEALEFACAYAPEHLLLAVSDPEAALRRVRNAGTVFLGEASSVTFGDYMTGCNHTLPTGGLARSYSGLSTLDFIRWTSYQRVSTEAAARMAGDVATFADCEGLPGHASAARAWGLPR
jgi:histidinol dehydrogenase